MNKIVLVALAALSIGTSTEVSAQSNVRELFKECARLYVIRNNFYNERGLCFTREGAKKLYPYNNGPLAKTCRYERAEDLPISASENRAIELIVAKEDRLGCKYVRP